MVFRDSIFENVIGDLKHDRRRGLIYLGFGVAALSVWILAPSPVKLTTVPLVFALGSCALLLKGIFFLRKSSDGLTAAKSLDLAAQRGAEPPDHLTSKSLPSAPALTAQIIQDFGGGGLLLAPVLHFIDNVDRSRQHLPSFRILAVCATLFCAGWAIRRLTSPRLPPGNDPP